MNLRQQALVAVRRAITTGEIPPGAHLVETELSEQLNISRGTLREALRELQQEGLVSAGDRGRLAVRSLNASEVVNIFQVRGALEALAASLIAAQVERDSAITSLRGALGSMSDALSGTLEERIEADVEFHLTLCRVSGNPTLLHSWRSLEGSIRMSFMWAGLDKAVGNMGVDRHEALVEVLETGDAQLAAARVREHMDEAAANLVQHGPAA